MAQLRKEADVIVNGAKWDIDPKSVKLEEGGVKREQKTASGHYTEEDTGSKLTFKLAASPTVDTASVRGTFDALVQVRWKSGVIDQIDGAFTLEVGGLDDGFYEVSMGGKPAKKV